jgi:hypothetical protein
MQGETGTGVLRSGWLTNVECLSCMRGGLVCEARDCRPLNAIKRSRGPRFYYLAVVVASAAAFPAEAEALRSPTPAGTALAVCNSPMPTRSHSVALCSSICRARVQAVEGVVAGTIARHRRRRDSGPRFDRASSFSACASSTLQMTAARSLPAASATRWAASGVIKPAWPQATRHPPKATREGRRSGAMLARASVATDEAGGAKGGGWGDTAASRVHATHHHGVPGGVHIRVHHANALSQQLQSVCWAGESRGLLTVVGQLQERKDTSTARAHRRAECTAGACTQTRGMHGRRGEYA